jgi:prefoldin subunit 5
MLKRQYAINKKLAKTFTNLKNANAALSKKNRTLRKKIAEKKKELAEISRRRNAKRIIDERNKQMNKWLKEQFARRR